MAKHKKVFLKFFDIWEGEYFQCQIPGCDNPAVDVHHILPKGRQGKDNIENLIGLCRDCHNIAHGQKKGVKRFELEYLFKLQKHAIDEVTRN